jgi:hypothetical protein
MRPPLPTSTAFLDLSSFASDHLIAGIFLGVFAGVALVLGTMHEIQIFGDALIPFIQHFKRECDDCYETWKRVKDELTRWKR